MLNPFPIQFLSMLAYMLLRLFVGGILIYLGSKHIGKRHDMQYALRTSLMHSGVIYVWVLSVIELLTGALFLLGLYTQIAALITIALSLLMIIFPKQFASSYLPGRMFYILLLAASLSLFVTGAGAVAFDLPI